ncbi:DUF4212 domain-containing protein [Pelagicoccus mobilis]|uniref:DUF4212 domain-containing protein n=1 Tax=Pelagicoccus mobilis TaxID=415221 RepID=A0A934RZ82_9BACT|nr:DUF4212 domain-containing protein [Pelagicoccus mobilis]MBK1876549.1 DUF4212 domain-containing protein [Pelagicoccus mobilis]
MTDSSSDEAKDGSPVSRSDKQIEKRRTFLRSSFKVILCLLPIWFFVSYGCGILFRDWLDQNFPSVGNAPFGFWMAQQGSIICFVLILITYAVLMNRLDRKYSSDEGE